MFRLRETTGLAKMYRFFYVELPVLKGPSAMVHAASVKLRGAPLLTELNGQKHMQSAYAKHRFLLTFHFSAGGTFQKEMFRPRQMTT